MVISAAVLICSGIILGAMAAHALTDILTEKMLLSFEKGVRYQFYAGFSLLIIGLSAEKFAFKLKWFYLLNLIGVILFSGCIYGYCFSELAPGLKPLVYLVPIGGSSLIAAWAVLLVQLLTSARKE